MRKNILPVIIGAALLLGAHLAEATVIYDWVTTGINDTNEQLKVEARYELTNQDYLDRLFFQSWLEVPIMIVSFPSKYGGIGIMPSRPNSFESHVVYGRLSDDRNKITNLGSIFEDLQVISGGVCYYNDDFIASVLATSICGGFDATVTEMIDGIQPQFNFSGEWVLREGTAPAVPEPGTFVLLGVGIGALVVWRRTQKGPSIR